jgi:hypothetical protein
VRSELPDFHEIYGRPALPQFGEVKSGLVWGSFQFRRNGLNWSDLARHSFREPKQKCAELSIRIPDRYTEQAMIAALTDRRPVSGRSSDRTTPYLPIGQTGGIIEASVQQERTRLGDFRI